MQSCDRLKRNVRATLIGLVTSVVLTAIKFTAGILGHSHALVADAVESLADIFSSLIVWRGLVVAAEPADKDHPYGHGKAEPLASAFVATMLLVASAWIVSKALRDIAEPHGAPAPFTLIVLIAVVVVKEILFRFMRREAESTDNLAVQTDASHHRSDAITSFAAGVGITISLVGGKGFESADDWAAIAAACVIGWNGWQLLRPALSELMDKAPSDELIQKIRAIAEAIPGAARVEKCLVRKMGNQYYVDMHLEVDPQMTVQRSHEIAHDVKDKVREALPSIRDVLVHIEPAGQRDNKL